MILLVAVRFHYLNHESLKVAFYAAFLRCRGFAGCGWLHQLKLVAIKMIFISLCALAYGNSLSRNREKEKRRDLQKHKEIHRQRE